MKLITRLMPNTMPATASQVPRFRCINSQAILNTSTGPQSGGRRVALPEDGVTSRFDWGGA